MKNKIDTVSFYVEKAQAFTIQVKAFRSYQFWRWNIYAHVFENHPKFDDDEFLLTMMPNGGCTYDAIIVSSPVKGIQYDWQKALKKKVIGSDYTHDWDRKKHQSPLEGIPYYVENDAKKLAKDLNYEK